MIGLIAAGVTILVGPATFFILSRTLYHKKTVRMYPTQINDGVGDILFLPLFNGILAELLVQHDVSLIVLLLSSVFAFLVSFWFVRYQKKASYIDWSKPSKGKINGGGWYHAVYMVFQTAVILYGLLTYSSVFLLWLCAASYIVLAMLQYYVYGYV